MSLNVTVAGTPVLEGIPPSSISAQMRAEDGDAGFGGFLIDDPTATVTTTGHKLLVVEETACSQPRVFMGYLTERVLSRSEDRALVAGDDARLHDVGSVDLNAVFNFRIIRGSGASRPEETMEDRLTWLLGSSFLSPFIADTGYVSMYALTMDPADYTGTTPATVLQDLVERKSDTPLTYFAFWDATASAVGLYFGGEDIGIGESPLSISNDLSDINGATIFAPDAEAKLRRTPEEVYSEVIVEYADGEKRIYRRRPATATAFGIDRGTTIQRPYTQSATTAQNQADRWLTKHAVERDEITVSIIVPPESAGLALAGQRIDVKFTHLPGYEAWTSMRIVTSTVTPFDDTATQYRVELVLVAPTPAGSGGSDEEENPGEVAYTDGSPIVADTQLHVWVYGGGIVLNLAGLTADNAVHLDGGPTVGWGWDHTEVILGWNCPAGLMYHDPFEVHYIMKFDTSALTQTEDMADFELTIDVDSPDCAGGPYSIGPDEWWGTVADGGWVASRGDASIALNTTASGDVSVTVPAGLINFGGDTVLGIHPGWSADAANTKYCGLSGDGDEFGSSHCGDDADTTLNHLINKASHWLQPGNVHSAEIGGATLTPRTMSGTGQTQWATALIDGAADPCQATAFLISGTFKTGTLQVMVGGRLLEPDVEFTENAGLDGFTLARPSCSQPRYRMWKTA